MVFFWKFTKNSVKINVKEVLREEYIMIRFILAIVLPPVSVFLSQGISQALFINIVLTLIGWVPGIIHALWILTKQPENVDV